MAMTVFSKSFTSTFHCIVSCPSSATIHQRKLSSFSTLFWCYLYLKSLLFPVPLKKRWMLPFCPCATATGLINSRAPNPNSSAPAGESAGPTGLCKTGTSLCWQQAWSCKPAVLNSQDKVLVQVNLFYLIVEHHRCHLQEQPVMQKEREVRFLIQGVLQNEF